MLCQRDSCSPAETVTSTIFRGATSCTVDHQPARARCDSSRAAHLCKPEICGSNATNAVLRATWPLLSANPVRKTCHDAAGRHPHLDHYDDDCREQARTVLLGATNSWFPITLSALAIPVSRDPVYQLVRNCGDYFKADIKGPEWEALTDPAPPKGGPHFLGNPAPVPTGFENRIYGILLLERLMREVNALLGFTRVEAPEEGGPDERPLMARLCSGAPTWVPSGQVHGEGIFIRFDEDALRKWEQRDSVRAREIKLVSGHKSWRNSRKLDPNEELSRRSLHAVAYGRAPAGS